MNENLSRDEISALENRVAELERENEDLKVSLQRARESESNTRLAAEDPSELVTLSGYSLALGLSHNAVPDQAKNWKDRGFPEPVFTHPNKLYRKTDIDMFREQREREKREKTEYLKNLPWIIRPPRYR